MGITAYLSKIITSGYGNPESMAMKIRRRRILPLLTLIEHLHVKYGAVKVIDIGGSKDYWGLFPNDFLERNKVHVTIIDLPGSQQPLDTETFKFVEGDGCSLSAYQDNSFNIVHSNSVIEHVGDWERMVSFAREVRRLAPNYFIQTPNFWFPIEPHWMTPMFHWLPKPVRVGLVMRFSLGFWKRCGTVDEAVRQVENARLLDKKMFGWLFKDAQIITERMFFLPKSLVAIRKEFV